MNSESWSESFCIWRIPAEVLSVSVKQKWLDRCKKLVRRLTIDKIKTVFFTDETNFYLNPPVNNPNDHVWASTRKFSVAAKRLLLKYEKFAKNVMVSAGFCFSGKGKLHFVSEIAKVSAKYYVENLFDVLSMTVRNSVRNTSFFSKMGLQHTVKLVHEWIEENCSKFIKTYEWHSNSQDLNPLHYHVWGAMLELYQSMIQSKTKDYRRA